MSIGSLDFRRTWLWQHVFVNRRSDATVEEQEFFREQYLQMRDKVGHLVTQISANMPEMTVHDLTHLDALWETASLVAEGSITLTPPEGFVFGASVLLHDSGMTVAAFPGGLAEIQKTVQWKDAMGRWRQLREEESAEVADEQPATQVAVQAVLPDVLRRLHAEQASILAQQAWVNISGEQQYLIADADVRNFYGTTIGEIAHSHWWTVEKVEQQLSQDLGPFPLKTRCLVDRIKVACLLRVADALHVDQLRAPRFLRTLLQPCGLSALHWTFQEKMARPHIEGDAVVFTTGQPFNRNEADAWWLGFDTLAMVDRELKDVDSLLQARGRESLKARGVKGAGSPERIARSVQTRNWRPVDARIRASDVPRIVENLGGAKLYGNDPFVPLRELIQNAADAIQARRKLQKRKVGWGDIHVSIRKRQDGDWLTVEDNGIGMSELVLTGPLLDFGTSFWRTNLMMEEFPGLSASGMKPIGRFGIGFFSTFMLGDVVRVISRRFDRGEETTRVLELRGGPAGRPILWPASSSESPIDGGTRVEILLRHDPYSEPGLLFGKNHNRNVLKLEHIVASLAPGLDVNVSCGDNPDLPAIVEANDWLKLDEASLLQRLSGISGELTVAPSVSNLIRPLKSSGGKVFGRAAISLDSYSISTTGWVVVSGLRANRLANIQGILVGDATTAARDSAVPNVPRDVLVAWASEQAILLSDMRLTDERKAKAAETILECGGEIGLLPILRWGGEWVDTIAFAERISELSELVVNFGGDFEYDEDIDEMHPREFKRHFEESDSILYVPRHNGSIVRSSGKDWPANLFDVRPDTCRLEERVRRIVNNTWKCDFDEHDDTREVGCVLGTPITRKVTVFIKNDEEELDA